MLKNESMKAHVFPEAGVKSKNEPWMNVAANSWVFMFNIGNSHHTTMLPIFPYF